MPAIPGLFVSPVPVVTVVAEPLRIMLFVHVLASVNLFSELVCDYILFLESDYFSDESSLLVFLSV